VWSPGFRAAFLEWTRRPGAFAADAHARIMVRFDKLPVEEGFFGGAAQLFVFRALA
jgi:hypothetical protein